MLRKVSSKEKIDDIKKKCSVTFPMKHHSIWYLDSGATEHMSPYLMKMENFRKSFSRVHTAHKEKIHAEGKGDITVEFSEKNGGLNAVLKNVLYVPNIDGNLLSVGRLAEKGLKVTFDSDEAKVLNTKGVVILKALRKSRLYEVEEQTQLGKVMIGESALWHRRFGHFDSGTLASVRKFYEESCPACVLGKMKTKLFFNCSTRSKRPLELIHSDFVGVIEPMSQGGSNYFVSFVDDYSRYAVVFPIKYADEVMIKFDEYRRTYENILGLKIKSVKTSSDSEYLNKDFDEYLIRYNIRRRFVISGMPQRNTVAKSLNQRLLSMTKCFVAESGIPKSLWADALVTACYLVNKCPCNGIDGRIPEALWTKKKVHIQHLRVFGCRAWITLNPTIKNGNLDFKAIECVFIGYSGDTNGYKLWERNQNMFYISKEVKFDENIFPCKKDYSEGRIFVKERKSNITTIRVENEPHDRPRKGSSINIEVSNCITEETEKKYEVRNHVPRSQEADEVSTADEISFQNAMSPNSKVSNENLKTVSPLRSKLFSKSKVFPFSNSKQKLMKSKS